MISVFLGSVVYKNTCCSIWIEWLIRQRALKEPQTNNNFSIQEDANEVVQRAPEYTLTQSLR